MKRPYLIIAAVIAVLVIGIVGNSDYEDAQRQQDEYCQMVNLWHQTKGKAGWPPFNGECNHEKY